MAGLIFYAGCVVLFSVCIILPLARPPASRVCFGATPSEEYTFLPTSIPPHQTSSDAASIASASLVSTTKHKCRASVGKQNISSHLYASTKSCSEQNPFLPLCTKGHCNDAEQVLISCVPSALFSLAQSCYFAATWPADVFFFVSFSWQRRRPL